MRRYPFLDLETVNRRYAESLRLAAERVISSGRYIGGEECAAFEKKLSDYIGCGSSVIGTGNGYDALRLILEGYKSLGRLKEGDEVIVPANTFIATVNAVVNSGLKPLLTDPDYNSMNITGKLASMAITSRTRAIITVHLYGSPAWDNAMSATANEHGLLVIEDAAQAIGAYSIDPGLNGANTVGTLGQAAAFSFYPTKNLGALGDGGAVATTDHELAATVRMLSNYGSDIRNHYAAIGFNSRLDPLQAAMLAVKMDDIDSANNRRRQKAALYSSLIKNEVVTVPYNPGSVWHQYVVRINGKQRDKFREYLLRSGVETDIHYPTPPHLQPCFNGMMHKPLPVTERLTEEIVSLPISDSTTIDDVMEISSIINKYSYLG